MKIRDFKRGMQIVYVPTHANGDLEHSDCEYGFVSSINDRFVFCRYWHKKRICIIKNTIK